MSSHSIPFIFLRSREPMTRTVQIHSLKYHVLNNHPNPHRPNPNLVRKTPWLGRPPNNRQQCTNSTRNQLPSDFETFCCDGDIIDTKFDLFHSGRGKSLDLNDLYCCQFKGPQQGGFGPIDTVAQTNVRLDNDRRRWRVLLRRIRIIYGIF